MLIIGSWVGAVGCGDDLQRSGTSSRFNALSAALQHHSAPFAALLEFLAQDIYAMARKSRKSRCRNSARLL